jgi:hypothetical protein
MSNAAHARLSWCVAGPHSAQKDRFSLLGRWAAAGLVHAGLWIGVSVIESVAVCEMVSLVVPAGHVPDAGMPPPDVVPELLREHVLCGPDYCSLSARHGVPP